MYNFWSRVDFNLLLEVLGLGVVRHPTPGLKQIFGETQNVGIEQARVGKDL
jgi:hypothetical protein